MIDEEMIERAYLKNCFNVCPATEKALRCVFHDPIRRTDVILICPKAIGSDVKKLSEFIEELRKDAENANVTKSIEETLRNICGEWGNYKRKYREYDKSYISEHFFEDRAELKAYLCSYQEEALSAICKEYGIRFYHLPTRETEDKMLDTFITKMEEKVKLHQR